MRPELDNPLDLLAHFDFEGQDEQSIRDQWISLLLRLLGYGLEGTIMRPKVLKLRPPLRKQGYHSWRLDYAPTVHRVGLWILEAKHPKENPFSDAHLSQAWWYATDPRVNVPMMVMTNGRRLGVFDLVQEEWDQPVLAVAHHELQDRFGEVENILGARRVAEYVRHRQLSHLGRALAAQVDESVLDETKRRVEQLCRDALPLIRRNRSALWFDTFKHEQRRHFKALRDLGLDALAEMANSPFVVTGGDVDECVALIRALDPDERKGALGRLRLPRTMFGLRVLRLATALRLVDDPVIGSRAAQVTRDMVAAHATSFADDPLEAATHRFEMALVPFTARVTEVAGADAAVKTALDLERRLDPHEFVRRDVEFGLSANAIVGRIVAAAVRRIWYEFEPWTAEVLESEARRLRTLAEKVGPQRKLEPGQVGDPYMDLWLMHDPLLAATRNIVTEVARNERLPEAVRSFAEDLLRVHFGGVHFGG